ncbi:DUF421 domain-containing protein [Mucilaginibacter arboris]|uniref:DUF421 domain-containing protein n=1 Tax=Mucilaginibacter arboris TaxID=2682090 RepID=A0A7K1T1G3_9SPHI|nr:YetF domain-containing protein [Mucilaginibacter arboris]MVN23120.1 DUF421 domain-containing protein [Mucilaginibacter arboris]
MKKDEIHLEDIKRILFGLAPPEFLIEVFFRTIIIYIGLLFIVRWMGKRMSGQLTLMEMAVMLTIGAIVSVPMQVPDRGLLQGGILLICIAFFQRGISLLGFKSGKIEDLTQGKASMLVKDGILQLTEMKKVRVSHQQLYAELRQENVFNLGIVDRVYLEACGIFSIFQSATPKPGLPIYPPDDKEIVAAQKPAIKSKEPIELLACINCGYVKPNNNNEPCADCGHKEWINAIN